MPYLYTIKVIKQQLNINIMALFNTAVEYQNELKRIQDEQKQLMKNENMRLKVNRTKKRELTEQFFAVKKDWRNNSNVAISVELENKAKEEEKINTNYVEAISSKLVVEGAVDLSNEEINRVLGECVGAKKLIPLAKKYRDLNMITGSDIVRRAKIYINEH